MAEAILTMDHEKVLLIEGVCACRILNRKPAILVTFGEWGATKITKSLTKFIGNYDPENYFGTKENFKLSYQRIDT
jgi:hypothetical protein